MIGVFLLGVVCGIWISVAVLHHERAKQQRQITEIVDKLLGR